MKRTALALLFLLSFLGLRAEDGYRLWLRYERLENPAILNAYRQAFTSIVPNGRSSAIQAAVAELQAGLQGMLGKLVPERAQAVDGSIFFLKPAVQSDALGKEGFSILYGKREGNRIWTIRANSDIGLLYGSFHLLRLAGTGRLPPEGKEIVSVPKIGLRLLNHWDNLNRHVERGYAGLSIWNWHHLPEVIDQRYIDYARANASIGINGTVLTNVNANALVLTPAYLQKVAALADAFRPFGIRVYLTARFSAPIEIGGLKTADPLNDSVRQWWAAKAREIYGLIPDFGGFLVKANSEGQPGPQNYGRSHADGANMLADAVAPFKGIVMWRAFVYSHETPEDRFKQAYNEFQPLDGSFRRNVLVQVKNGPIDFQPREPFSPLFGAMPKTPMMMEFQITQEYLGQATHLVYEAPMFKEVLQSDTYRPVKGSTVAQIIDGSAGSYPLTGIAGVSNIGNERNWTGHPFAQANWYAFGRLSWDHQLSSEAIAEEWIVQTFSSNAEVQRQLKRIMMRSYEAMVNYMTPLGLHHIMGTGHHYGPAPWVDNVGRADWNPVYYHKADSIGLGFDRTATGSNALAQYAPEVQKLWGSVRDCPDQYLLWFHHLPWHHRMRSGRTLWDELCHRYQQGVEEVSGMIADLDQLRGRIDAERLRETAMLLNRQLKEARWWRDACLLYFQSFSKLPFPPGHPKPEHDLEYYRALRFPYAPGNG